MSVFVAVPFFASRSKALANYLKSYVKPTFIMLPFNIISELSRTLASGRPFVRQHDERGDDYRYPTHYYALRSSRSS